MQDNVQAKEKISFVINGQPVTPGEQAPPPEPEPEEKKEEE